MRVLAFAASLRRASLNRKLVEVAAGVARAAGAQVDLAEFREFDMPIYDGDLDASAGLPPGATELRRRLEQTDAVVIAAPEYNYSIAGPLKNAIDWVSRARPLPWRGEERPAHRRVALADGGHPRPVADAHPARGVRRAGVPGHVRAAPRRPGVR